jgi:hypothetical protein
MSARIAKFAALVVVAVLIVAGSILIGRATVDDHAAHEKGYQSGLNDGYFKGLPVGEAQGRQEGRSLQEGNALPAADSQPVQDAFNAGYTAGTTDAFAGYDGGWDFSTPYVVSIQAGSGAIVYRIDTREPVQADVNYYLCPDRHDLCQEPRR